MEKCIQLGVDKYIWKKIHIKGKYRYEKGWEEYRERRYTRRGGTWMEVHKERFTEKAVTHGGESHPEKIYTWRGDIQVGDKQGEEIHIFFLPILLLFATR